MKKLISITAVAASLIVSACGGGGAADASAGTTPVVVTRTLDLSLTADAKAAVAFWIQNHAGLMAMTPMKTNFLPVILSTPGTINSVANANCRYGGSYVTTLSKQSSSPSAGNYQSRVDSSCKLQRAQPDGEGTSTDSGEFRLAIESVSGTPADLTLASATTSKVTDQRTTQFDEVRSGLAYAGQLSNSYTGNFASSRNGMNTLTSDDDVMTEQGSGGFETTGTINGSTYSYKASVNSNCNQTGSLGTVSCPVRNGTYSGEVKALGKFNLDAAVLSPLQLVNALFNAGSLTLQQGGKVVGVVFAPGVNGDAIVTVTGPDGVNIAYSFRSLSSMVLY